MFFTSNHQGHHKKPRFYPDSFQYRKLFFGHHSFLFKHIIAQHMTLIKQGLVVEDPKAAERDRGRGAH
jgi:hypothetical protein